MNLGVWVCGSGAGKPKVFPVEPSLLEVRRERETRNLAEEGAVTLMTPPFS